MLDLTEEAENLFNVVEMRALRRKPGVTKK